jgi:hypothetical protein
MLNSMDIIFACMIFQVSSDLQFKSEFSEEIQINELNLLVIENTFYNCPKMVHVGLHSVETYHKKFGWQNKKIKIYFVECLRKALGCQTWGTRQRRFFAECQYSALGKCNGCQLGPLLRVALRRVSRTRQRNLYRVYSFAESHALGKRLRYREQDFAEYGTRQRLLCRAPDKKHSTKRRALGKGPDSGNASIHVYTED